MRSKTDLPLALDDKENRRDDRSNIDPFRMDERRRLDRRLELMVLSYHSLVLDALSPLRFCLGQEVIKRVDLTFNLPCRVNKSFTSKSKSHGTISKSQILLANSKLSDQLECHIVMFSII